MPLSNGMLLGPYEILALLGAGGMGEVYRARDEKLNRSVALKVLPAAFVANPDRLARLQHEARILASLNHPNIAAIYSLEGDALVMELVEGKTLADRIRTGPIPVKETLPILRQIAEALDYAHEKGIVHRDLKPVNIMIAADGVVKVLDFGLAKAFEVDSRAPCPENSPTVTMSATPDGVICGTPSYMSPEQARGLAVDKRGDIWAFGAVLYEALTGRRLYGRQTFSDTLAAVLTEEPNWNALPVGTPPGLRSLLARCLEKDRKRRLRDIGDALPELEEKPAQPIAPSRSGWRLAWGVTGSLGVACLALALMYFWGKPAEVPLIRLSLLLPEKSALGEYAISPDGQRLAFTARSLSGKTALWVRRLDESASQPLPETDGGSYPFWSPDSHWIGFFAGDKLKKIEASGGLAQTLCDAQRAKGGTWTHGAAILFAAQGNSIARVPDSGGEAKPWTEFDASHQEYQHMWPWLLPDGKHFLLLVLSPRADVQGIWVASLDRPAERRRLLGDASMVQYAQGHLLFIRNSKLVAQPFDPERLVLRGEAIALIERGGYHPNVSGTEYSVSQTGVLVYGASTLAGTETQLTWFDRSGKPVGTVGSSARYLRVSLSPDQSHAAVDAVDPVGNWDIFVIDMSNGAARRLTFDPSWDWNPVWSHDGRHIVFMSTRDGIHNAYQKLANGAGAEEPLLKTGMNKAFLEWSPDGRYLLYTETGAKTLGDLWVLPNPGGSTAGQKPVVYLRTEFDERDGRFSPDGRKVAYVSNESGRPQIFVQTFPAGSGKWQVSTGGGDRPRWRRDGKELFYIAPDGTLMVVDVQRGAEFQAGSPKPLFQTRLGNALGDYAVSANGDRFLVPIPQEHAVAESITIVLNWMKAARR